MNRLILFAFLMCMSFHSFGQDAIIEGYIYAEENGGFLKNVDVTLVHLRTGKTIIKTRTDKDGRFSVEAPRSKEYKIIAEKRMFFPKEEKVTTVGLVEGEKTFLKFEMNRKPGYFFDVTLAESGTKGEMELNAIVGARIEVYNNTTRKEELALDDFPYPNFNFGFEKGNHYTIMIRKKGFLTKRVEAYIDVEDCILCFDGLGTIAPQVTDVLTHGHETGTFLANIELEAIEVNKTFRIENIYYDFDKWNIRSDAAEELDKLAAVLKDNPGIKVELGSHTDSRGSDPYNLVLSNKRAASAVEYIVSTGYIDAKNITSKGYGESNLINGCEDGVPCDEDAHQRNRRTELKILGIAEEDPLDKKTLKEIIEEEKLMEEILNQEVIRIPEKK